MSVVHFSRTETVATLRRGNKTIGDWLRIGQPITNENVAIVWQPINIVLDNYAALKNALLRGSPTVIILCKKWIVLRE